MSRYTVIDKFIPLNRVIKTLITYDLFFNFGWGLVMPVLAIFVADKIQGGDVQVVGIAIGIYWLAKSILQIPIAKYLDADHGEKDDYYALISGTFLTTIVPIGFIFSYLSWHIYILQLLQAFGMALVIPSWSGIFTRHIDKEKEALSWSFDSSAVGMGTGFAGIIGGIVAKTIGFTPLFIIVSASGIIVMFLCFLISEDLLPKTQKDKAYLMPKGPSL